jgi:hypothetical protein
MTKKLLLFVIFLFPVFLFAQSTFSDCARVFTKVEHLPSLKISDEAFEDTLAKVLTSKRFRLNDNEITYKFIVTDKSKIDDLIAIAGSVRKEDILKETILKLADLWKPATQNGYVVCAYVSLKLKFVDNKINIEIMQ